MKHVLAVLFMVIWFASIALADNDEKADTTSGPGSDWLLELDPDDQPYPDYIADPRRPRMQVGIGVADSEIPDTSSGRVMLDLGTRYTLFRIRSKTSEEHEFALNVEGGLFTQFDPVNELDSIGWDGRFGVLAVWGWNDKVVARTGYRHLSGHLGDEYIEKTGRKRIGYTRDDLVLGLGYFLSEQVFIYFEPSWSWSVGNEERQEPWAVEGGIQYQGPRDMWNNSTAFYAGTHVRAFEETSWEPGLSVQTGLHVKRDKNSSNLRLALEGYVGRAILSEFALDYDEAYLMLEFIFDFY